eukprot:PhF_6_TR20822/c0_g2_i1/m.29963
MTSLFDELEVLLNAQSALIVQQLQAAPTTTFRPQKASQKKRSEFRPAGSVFTQWNYDKRTTRGVHLHCVGNNELLPGPADSEICVVPDTLVRSLLSSYNGDFTVDAKVNPFGVDLSSTFSIARRCVNMFCKDLEKTRWTWAWDRNNDSPATQPRHPA